MLVSLPILITGLGTIIIGKMAVVAHWPAFGVNVYVLGIVLLIIAGLHEPIIPFKEVVCKIGDTLPAHNGKIGANVGVINAFIVTAFVMLVAHWPAVGVKI
jgi:hypothetical protein